MRRGALLLETLLALAIFTTAAGFTIMAIRDGSASAERATLKSRAVDMAASHLASIEAGIIPLVSGPGCASRSKRWAGGRTGRFNL